MASGRRRKARARLRKAQKALRQQQRQLELVGFTSVESSPFDSGYSDVNDVLLEQQQRFNETSDIRRSQTFMERGYARSYLEYERIANILGNSTFQKLKEAKYLDSDQVIDAIQSIDMQASEIDIERALLNMIGKINNVETAKMSAFNEAIDAGFNVTDAKEYAGLVAEDLGGFDETQGFIQLVDELHSIIAENDKRERIRRALKNVRNRKR